MATPRVSTPDGCRHCGVAEYGHAGRWMPQPVGWHEWAAPSDEQRKARMLARRGENAPESPQNASEHPEARDPRGSAA